MKLRYERIDKAIGRVTVLDGDALNRNSVLVHELAVQVELYDSEAVYATYGTKDLVTGQFTATTQKIALQPRQGAGEYYALIPNIVLAEAGTKWVSITITMPADSNDPNGAYRRVNSGMTSFAVSESLGDMGYEPIEQSEVARLDGRINDVERDMGEVYDAAKSSAQNAAAAQAAAETVRQDNIDFKQDITARQEGFELSQTERQTAYETGLTDRQAQYETGLTNRQTAYEAELTGKQTDYEQTVNTRMSAAESTATSAATLAGGLDAQIKQAVAGSEQANQTADEAKRIATDAKEGSGTAVKRQNGEVLDFVPEVVLEGEGEAVMTSEAVKKQLIGTVMEKEYAGDILSIPGTGEGFVNQYELYGKSVQDVSPNLFSTTTNTNTRYGLTFTNDRGAVSYSGTPINELGTLYEAFTMNIAGVVGKTVRFSYSPTSSDISFRLRLYRNNTIVKDINNNETYAVPSDIDRVEFIVVTNVKTPLSATVRFMLNEGTTAFPFQPYTGQPAPDNPIAIQSVPWPARIVSAGKNLLQVPDKSVTLGGLTAQSQNGVVSISGTKTADADVYFREFVLKRPVALAQGRYTFSINAEYPGNWNLRFYDKNETSFLYVDQFTSMKEFTFELTQKAHYVSLGFYLSSDIATGTVFNETLYPQLELGTTATAYEPYASTTTQIQPLLSDGTAYTEPLRSVGDVRDTLDSENNTIVQRVGVINLRGRTWQLGGNADSVNRFYYTGSISDASNDNVVGRQMCIVASSAEIGSNGTQTGFIATAGVIRFRPDLTKYPTLASWQEYSDNNDIIITYELATSITHQLQPLPQIPTQSGHTTLWAEGDPAPGLWCLEFDKAQIGSPTVLTNNDGTVLNPVTREDMVLDPATGVDLGTKFERLNAENGAQNAEMAEHARQLGDLTTSVENIVNGQTKVKFARNSDTAMNASYANYDSDGNVFSTTYAKTAGEYPNIIAGRANLADYATLAADADRAIKATQDATGNNFATVYAKQNGTYDNLTAGDSKKINGVELKPNAKGTLSFGNYVIERKRLVWNRGELTSSSPLAISCSYGGDSILEFSASNHTSSQEELNALGQVFRVRIVVSSPEHFVDLKFDNYTIRVTTTDNGFRFTMTGSGALEISKIYIVLDE